MEEIWKDIPGYEGSHQVSNLGRVKSLDRIVARGKGTYRIQRGNILRPFVGHEGYLRVDLCQEDRQRKYGVHVLVALAFLGARPEGYDIHHVNGNRTDNRPENLQYKSKADHVAGENSPTAKRTAREIVEIRQLYAEGNHTQAQLAKMYGFSSGDINHILMRRAWRHV